MTKIPARRAVIHFRRDRRSFKVSDVAVHNTDAVRDGIDDHDYRPQSLGAWSADWESGEDPRATLPGVFVNFLLAGFNSPEDLHQALQEFSKVEGAEWAQAMSDALALELKARRK